MKSGCSSPAVLHACHDSREAALKHYEGLELGTLSTKAMINWSLDTLFINKSSPTPIIEEALQDANFLSKCRKVAMINVFFYQLVANSRWQGSLQRFEFETFKPFKEVEELLLVVDSKEKSGGESVRQGGNFKFMTAKKGACKFKESKDHLRYFLASNLNFNSASLVSVMNNDEYDSSKVRFLQGAQKLFKLTFFQEHRTPHICANVEREAFDAVITKLLGESSTNLSLASGPQPGDPPVTERERQLIMEIHLESFRRRLSDMVGELMDVPEFFRALERMLKMRRQTLFSGLGAVSGDDGN